LPLFGHVVTGKSALAFAQSWQEAWEDLFWNGANHEDRDLRGMRGLRYYWMAKVALGAGRRDLTLQWLGEAIRGVPKFWDAICLYGLVFSVPSAKLAKKGLNLFNRMTRLFARLGARFDSTATASSAKPVAGTSVRPAQMN
jgi:hypothetical protein